MIVTEINMFNHTEIIKALGRHCDSAEWQDDVAFSGISTDSRTIKKGDLFFALVGDNFDGHDYLQQAIANGAAGVLVMKPQSNLNVPVYIVDDTLVALGALARFHRSRFEIRCLAITGSNGKTTTKELMAACVESKFSTLKSEGNFNNLIGLPLTLFRLDSSYQAAVLELGMSTPGEMTRLAQIANPDIAVFTNIAPVHLQTLGTIENVAKAKYELVENLPVSNTVIVNNDDPFLSFWPSKSKHRFITYAVEGKADIVAENVSFKNSSSSFTVSGIRFKSNYPGRHNIYNALAAIVGGIEAGCDLLDMSNAFAGLKPSLMRSQVVKLLGADFIVDCYNANPESMKTAIDMLAEFKPSGKKIAVLGDMFELGEKSADFHMQIGKYLNSNNIEILLTVGKDARYYNEVFSGSLNNHYESKNDLTEELKSVVTADDTVLIKGSRGMAMEDIIKKLEGNT